MSTVRLVDTPSFDEAALPLALVDLRGRVVRANEALATFLARPAEQIVGRDLAEFTHPDDVEAMQAFFAKAGEDGVPGALETRYLRRDGAVVWGRVTPTMVPDAEGRPAYVFAQVLDVTERRVAEERGERVRRLYAALADTVELAHKAQTRAEMFEGACRVLVDAAGLRLASVAVLDETTGDESVTVVAGPPGRVGDELADLTAARLPLDPADPRAGTPAARALAQGVAAWSGDFETDPAMAPLREQARRAQLRSAAAVPLRVDGRVVGVLATFAATPGFFDQAVLTLVERVGGAISRGWEALESAARRQAAEDELRARIAQQSTVVHLGEEALVVDDVGDLMRSAVDAVARTLGVPLAEVRLTGAVGERMWRYGVIAEAAPPEGEEGAEAAAPEPRRASPPVAAPESLLRFVLASSEPVVFDDLAAERRCGVPEELIAAGARAGIAVRLEGRSTSYGLLAVYFPEPRPCGEGDRGFLQAVASVLGRAIERREEEQERERLDAQLRQSQRLESLGQLAGGVAHDFNNLLAALRIRVDLARGHVEDPEALTRDLGQLAETLDRATHLAQRLTTFSRRDPVDPRLVDVAALVRQTEELFARTLGQVRLEVCPPADPLPPVLIDPGQLEQVLVNLVVNARDAMPRGGRITVETSLIDVGWRAVGGELRLRPGRYVVLAVTDTGTGMPPEVVAHACEPFFTTKPKGSGTGLGLATVHGIVTAAGGDLSIYSEVGVGTTVRVYLPAALGVPVPRSSETPPSPPVRRARARGEHVLVLDDDPAVRTALTEVLTAAGYRVSAVATGTEALARVAAGALPEILVTDVLLPGLSGPEVAARLKRIRPGVAIVFVSGYSATALAERDLVAADSAFLQKPFSTDELLHAVEEVLAARRR